MLEESVAFIGENTIPSKLLSIAGSLQMAAASSFQNNGNYDNAASFIVQK
jgi:hypothetical protein